MRIALVLVVVAACGSSSDATKTGDCLTLQRATTQQHGSCKLDVSGLPTLLGIVEHMGAVCPAITTCPTDGWSMSCSSDPSFGSYCTYEGNCQPIASDNTITCDFVQTLDGKQGMLFDNNGMTTCEFRECE